MEALAPRPIVPKSGRWMRLMPSAMAARLRSARSRTARAKWRNRFETLSRDESPGSAIRLIGHYYGERRNAANYFSFRAGQPKYLITLALSQLTRATSWKLDVGCGAGHITRVLNNSQSPGKAVGLDRNFFLLWLANSRIAPDSKFVCCDVEQGLPLVESVFDFALLSNFFHFVYQKRFMLAELKRVGRASSVVVISSLRNQNVETPTPNIALSPEGYQNLADEQFETSTMISESALLEQMVLKATNEFPHAERPEALKDEPMINLILTNSAGFSTTDNFRSEKEGAVYRINPLYRRRPDMSGDMAALAARWPSEQYLEDNPELRTYLPDEMDLPAGIVSALDKHEYVTEMEPLVREGVLVDLPASY
jgi:SAM-dependent methyltransferase